MTYAVCRHCLVADADVLVEDIEVGELTYRTAAHHLTCAEEAANAWRWQRRLDHAPALQFAPGTACRSAAAPEPTGSAAGWQRPSPAAGLGAAHL